MLPEEVAKALERGATVITANQRAARTLRQGFDRRQRALGLESWEPPKVLAWDGWTAGLWHGLVMQGDATQLLLNRTQEQQVWQRVLASDAELRSFRTDALAGMAAESWGRLCAYGGVLRLRELTGSTDARAFQRWAMGFERRCRAEGYLTQGQLEAVLQGKVAEGKIRPEQQELALVGFDGWTPAQRGLLEEWRKQGGRAEEVPVGMAAEEMLLVEAEDEREELRVCARWVRAYLAEHAGARVAVMVPGLAGEKSGIDRVFREVLTPELEDIAAAESAGVYEFSVGVALEATAMVRVALDVLRWMTGPLTVERISGLLASPYFAGNAAEPGVRAEFDAYGLRRVKMLRPEMTVAGLTDAVKASKQRAGLVDLAEILQAVERVRSQRIAVEETRPYGEWAESMRAVLEAADWGAGEGEDSVEFQTREKWESALDELATLDFEGVRVGYLEALTGVERIVRQTIFAAQSREAPVQVMGPLEGAGGVWDAVWFLRAGDLSWTAARMGSSLLPWQVQEELGIPGTDGVRDREEQARLARRIATSAATEEGRVVFSYAAVTVNGRQRAAAALEGLQLTVQSAASLVEPEAERGMVAVDEMEEWPGLPQLPDAVSRGGAKILELQAACGFRAFAEQRLWASELRETELGMDPSERGIVVHKALEIFWSEVETQAALRAMSMAERTKVLAWSIDGALQDVRGRGVNAWDAAYVEMQRARLHRLLEPWLDLELERLEFDVRLREHTLEDVRLGPLRLKVRVDRVDSTELGDVILDYKTGHAAASEWMSERPDAPQLPLYAILSETEKLAGVAFAQVRAGKDRGLHGLAVSKDVGIKIGRNAPENLELQVEDWRRVLTRLAEEFAGGDVRVRPKQYPQTCEFCGQRGLCRVNGAALDDDETKGESLSEVEGG